jgi:hypothetical protein
MQSDDGWSQMGCRRKKMSGMREDAAVFMHARARRARRVLRLFEARSQSGTRARVGPAAHAGNIRGDVVGVRRMKTQACPLASGLRWEHARAASAKCTCGGPRAGVWVDGRPLGR